MSADADDSAPRVAELGLEPHPEGGHYRRVHTSAEVDADGRPAETAIVYLLRAGERSHWHRIDAAETWSHLDGAPLLLSISPDGFEKQAHRVGPDDPPVTVPPHAWQAAVSDGAWSLVRCTVRPGFRFEGFELAPPEWRPGDLI